MLCFLSKQNLMPSQLPPLTKTTGIVSPHCKDARSQTEFYKVPLFT